MTAGDTPPAEQRTGEVRGDRLCLKCGFNLHGQSILREPHYNLLIVRCPECATVAGLQEYPSLGRWARRWAFVLAGVYALIVFVAFVVAGLASGGVTLATAEEFEREVASHVAAEHRAWFQSTDQATVLRNSYPNQQAAVTQTITSVGNWGSWAAVNEQWWRTEGEQKVREVIGRSTAARASIVLALTLIPLGGVVMGMVFASLLPGLRGMRLVLIPVLVGLVAGAMSSTIRLASMGPPATFVEGYVRAVTLAREIVPQTSWLVLLGLLLIGLTVGAFIGRGVVRLVIRLLLPPRVAASLSYLWEADGKTYRHRRA